VKDEKIIDLYLKRVEGAIEETAVKYGNYCFTIANNILKSHQDAEECVSETYLKTWENIPPVIPIHLGAFLGKITRNLSLDRYKFNRRKKREKSEFELLLSELEDCIPGEASTEMVMDYHYTTERINDWLKEQDRIQRQLFIRRYWYSDGIADLVLMFGMSESKVKSMLFRMRKKLKVYLEKEGIVI